MEIKFLDPEKIFEECLYMGVAAGHLTQISGINVVFPIEGGSTRNLAFLAKLFRRCLSSVNIRWTPEHRDRRQSIDIQ